MFALSQSATTRIASVEGKLTRWPKTGFIVFVVVVALALTLFFFSPCWWLFREAAPESFQWSRGLGYLSQCEHPLRTDIEPALRWRLLPPGIAHALGLHETQCLAIPWVGVVALLTGCAIWGETWLGSRVSALAFTIIIATTSAVLVPICWIGMNDSWAWLGLLAVCLGRTRWVLPLACLLCPWIDERFMIGLPLALLCRQQILAGDFRLKKEFTGLVSLLPYLIVRTIATLTTHDTASGDFLHSILVSSATWLPLAPMGWWMALRASWFLVAASCVCAIKSRHGWRWAIITLGTLGIGAILATDLSRTAAMMIPLIAAGAITLKRTQPETASFVLILIAAANLILPAAHVVYTHVNLIYPLPIELYRLLR